MTLAFKGRLPALLSLVVLVNARAGGNDGIDLSARATGFPNPCGSGPYGGAIACPNAQKPYCTVSSGSVYLCTATTTTYTPSTTYPPTDPLAMCTPACTPGINFTTRTVWTECSCMACPTPSCSGYCDPGSTNAITTGTNGCSSCGSCVPTGNVRREPAAQATPAVTHL
ncbi:hypothetical protein CC1G_10246 [Coprinopsis cinerea okayama7|uniref:TNFR-Cys domain-containing protein n=1 Tax=Coprinopsis cinerea (strain Okayama-7 / 130 / ATCC MYA-4618 / FGSC 9003) TaxID=240176 RepID=A8NPE4_COPC7|nr:hypothetical protein CC1G_10246 [Coprinopsis cinerea okayama7\|eukprot:XP_001835319.1 hypothetical protein CC1G_10246 [Coprinopsis cinerea okayama7\